MIITFKVFNLQTFRRYSRFFIASPSPSPFAIVVVVVVIEMKLLAVAEEGTIYVEQVLLDG